MVPNQDLEDGKVPQEKGVKAEIKLARPDHNIVGFKHTEKNVELKRSR